MKPNIKSAQEMRCQKEDARIRQRMLCDAYAQDPNGDGDEGRDYFSEAANSEMAQDE